MPKQTIKIPEHFLCTQEEFDNKKTRDFVPIKCSVYGETFQRIKKILLLPITTRNTLNNICSNKCTAAKRFKEANTLVNCLNYGKEFFKRNRVIEKYPNSFCNHSCSASHQNKNKTYGTRRSKFEVYTEEQLTLLYPQLDILYSNKKVIGSELDIYIPSLKLAIEIQGIFHYKPIYGELHFGKIRTNDLKKIIKCHELGISLIHVDISHQQTFTIKSSEPYLKEIIHCIEKYITTLL